MAVAEREREQNRRECGSADPDGSDRLPLRCGQPPHVAPRPPQERQARDGKHQVLHEDQLCRLKQAVGREVGQQRCAKQRVGAPEHCRDGNQHHCEPLDQAIHRPHVNAGRRRFLSRITPDACVGSRLDGLRRPDITGLPALLQQGLQHRVWFLPFRWDRS